MNVLLLSDSMERPLTGRHEQVDVRSFPGARPKNTAVINFKNRITENQYQAVIFLRGNALSDWKDQRGVSPFEVKL